MPKIEPAALTAHDGEVFDAGPFHLVTRVTGEQTGGAFELYDLLFAPGTVDYHIHRKMDETILVIEGEVEFLLAGKSYKRTAGSAIFAPRGIHHGFINHGPGPVRVMLIFNPASSQDAFFRELVRIFKNGPPNPEELKAAQVKFDQELVAFP